MGKTSDITGTFRVPEEAWGKFWNLMLTIPGADITPNVRGPAQEKAKRKMGNKAEGTTGRCIVLKAVAGTEKPVPLATLQKLMTDAGKAPASLHGLLHAMKTAKQIKQSADGCVIMQAGRQYLAQGKCK
jgi:hypothetical protein